MTQEPRPAAKSIVLATAALGFACGAAASAVYLVWWVLGPNSVSCYYGSYEPEIDDTFGDLAAKMWPTWWVWIGLVLAPTVVGAGAGLLARRLGFRVERSPR